MPTTSQLLDAMLEFRLGSVGTRWNFPASVGTYVSAPGGIGQAVSMTYAYPTSLPAYYNASGITGFAALDPAQAAAADQVFAHFAEVSQITFRPGSPGNANISVAQYGTSPASASPGYANFPAFGYSYFFNVILSVSESGGGSAGDVWIRTGSHADAQYQHGGYGYGLLLHEIGHALGLKHPFEGAAVLPAALDQVGYTVMAYNPAPHSVVVTVTGTEQSFLYAWQSLAPRTLMVGDMLALQYAYGANNAFNRGDNTYTWAVNDRFLETIWDAGGTDTIDCSNQTLACVIKLAPGAYSSIGLRQTHADLYIDIPAFAVSTISADTNPDLDDAALYNGLDNLGIAHGADIENAIGGSGNDTITGNALDNLLRGNAGNDILIGDAGADSLDGGTGNDAYVIDSAGDVVVETSSEPGWDYIDAFVSRTLEANVEAMIMHSGANGTGNSAANALYGNSDSAANTLTGMDSSDIYSVGAGDVVVEASGAAAGSWDFINAYVSRTLELNVEAMIMLNGSSGTGNAQDNALYGNYDATANTLTGGDGNDVYNVGAGDVVVETPTGGTWDYIHAFVSRTLEANVEAMIMYNGATGTGNSAANTLYGNWDLSANLLVGGDGDDTYVVLAGDTVQESASQGTDTVVAFASFTLSANVENLALSGTDPINGTGNAQNNLILGNGADNEISGKDGNDRLYGGNGIDRFVFDAAPNAATNVDVITDFTPGTDKLVLDHLIFTQLAGGNLQPGNLVAANGAFASQGDDHVLYDSTGGNLFYDSDGSGAAAPVWLAHLDGNPALAAGDFSVT